MEVFLAEPFLRSDILDEIPAPTAGAAGARPAVLRGYSLRSDLGRLRLGLVADPAAEAGGQLVAFAPDAAERLGFVMAAFGAGPRRATVRADDGERAARAYMLDEPDAPPADLPDARYLREVMREVLGHFGRTDPAQMPALMHGIGFRAIARLRGRARQVPNALGSRLDASDVEVLDLTYAYADYFGVETRALRHRRFDGGWSEVLRRSVLTSGDAVTVLPFDPRRASVLLVEQFRAGAHARGDARPWFLEAVAGRCDGLEDPEETARREAEEEAGLALGRLERIAAYYTTPGIAAEFITAFVGEADLDGAGGLHGLPEESEDIRALVLPLAEAFAAVASGEIGNAPLLLSLFWLQQHHGRLTAAWT